MAVIVVAGGGICGSAVALMLARDSHDVTLTERDERPSLASVTWWTNDSRSRPRQP